MPTLNQSFLLIVALAIISTVACRKSQNDGGSAQRLASFYGLSVDQINQYLQETDEKLSPSDIMKRYYPIEPAQTDQGNETISIITDGSAIDQVKVILVHDNLLDQNVRAYQYVMVVAKNGEKWLINEIDKSWKCWRDPENGDWKYEECI